jgi:aminopeptidase
VTDPRVERLAQLLSGYALNLEQGDLVRFDGGTCAAPLLAALFRAALERGAHPYVNAKVEGLDRILLEEGSNAQIEYISSIEWAEIDALDALVTVWSEENTRALSRVDPDRQARLLGARSGLARRRWERIETGEMRWCGTLFPTQAHAQDADMSLADYERFVFRACHVDEDGRDPAEHWRSTSGELESRAKQLGEAEELRILGPDTDLRVGVAGRRWIAADGRLNMPDGEVFTSPVETETEGEIRFQFPAIFRGREVEDVRLRFERGRVVKAEAQRGEEYLASLLEIEGARVLGEVAFGLNYEIDRFTRNILFDEKIGGTMHVALGASFPQTGGKNVSGLHWDLICDLREGGEVYADGRLVHRDGQFVDAAPLDSEAG